MPVLNEGEVLYKNWSSLIKADKISEVLAEAAENTLAGEKALECLVHISNLAYNDSQKGVAFKSPPDDTAQLTQVLCSTVIHQPSLCNLRFISSLYHIAYFFYKKNQHVCLERIYKIFVDICQCNIKTFQGDGTQLYDNLINLLKKVISNLATDEDVPFDSSSTKKFFFILSELTFVEDKIGSEPRFLESVLYVSHNVGKKNKKIAVILINKGLQLFSEVKKMNDLDSSLSLVIKLLSYLFKNQLDLTGFSSALDSVMSNIEITKWKFGKENLLHGKCFTLMSQAKMLISSQSKVTVDKMIKNFNMILTNFMIEGKKKDVVKETYLLIIYLVSNLTECKTITSSVLFDDCMGPFLDMMLTLYSTLKEFNVDQTNILVCICNCFYFISEVGQKKKLLLEKNLDVILRSQTFMFEVSQMLWSENHAQAEYYTKIAVTRCTNLIRAYQLASLEEEVIAISKSFCKFACSLPSYFFDNSTNQAALLMSFSCLIRALGPKKLNEELEIIVAWLILCPQDSDRIFKMWGDVKHNAVCAGGSEFLDTTIFTIATEGKRSLEENWIQCSLNTAQLGNVLLKELNTYFINTTLRGSPVFAAAKTLESLPTDDLTQVRGVGIALDVATANSEYEEHCDHFHNRSKQLIAKLRKQKNQLDPVEYNCCMAELLYAQFRLKLKSFRSSCTGEMVRLSVLHESVGPLVPELPEERPDPNDTCDVTPRVTNLSLDKQKKLLAYLDTPVKHWQIACSRLNEIDNLKCSKYDLRLTLANLHEAAVIMKLYCEDIKESEIWKLLYSLAHQVDDTNHIVIAFVGMSKTKNINRATLEKVEDILTRDDLVEKTKQAFFINRALNCMNKNKINEGFKLLETKMYGKKGYNAMIQISWNITLGLYQKLKDWEMYKEKFLTNPSCHFSLHKALTHLLFLVQQQKWSSLIETSCIQLNLFEVSYQLGEINWALEQPREARCYLKSVISIAQKLGLPLRTAQLLLLLAWVDLYTGSTDDCAVKLEGLEALLNLQGTSAIAGFDSPQKLSKEEVWSPEFLSHTAGCDCSTCSCVEYQRLVLETLTLRAMFCTHQNQPTLALQSFKVATEVEDFLSKSDDMNVKESCSRLWKHYTQTFNLCNMPARAIDVNERAVETLSVIQNPTILSQYILPQKCGLQNWETSRQKPFRHRIKLENLETEETVSYVRTPVSKQAKTPFPKKTPLTEVSDNITPKLVRPVRNFILPSSGDENTPPPKSKIKTKTSQKLRLETQQTSGKLNKIKPGFTIVDDDGNSVGISSGKVASRVKKKTDVKTNNVVDPIHKKLFTSDEISHKKSDAPDWNGMSPVRKSNRKPTRWISQTEKSKPNLESSCKHQSSRKEKNEVFSCDSLKVEVSKVNCSVPKSTYGKSSAKRQSKTEVCSKSEERPVNEIVDNDYSMVEGTPTPPGTCCKNQSSRKEKNEVFSFDSLKVEVSKVNCSVHKSTYGKSSAKRQSKTEICSKSEERPVNEIVDSDCSVVEGTPTPPGTRKFVIPNLKPRRVTRSNKT